MKKNIRFRVIIMMEGLMLISLTIGPLTIDTGSIISFILGILTGVFFILILYMYAVFRELKADTVLQTQDNDVDEDMVLELIKDAQIQFKNKDQRKKIGYAGFLFQISRSLALDISHMFYPDSSTPYLELTLDETLMLNHYVTNRVDDLTNRPLLKLFRRYTLSTLYGFTKTSKKIKNNKMIKGAKDYGLDEVYKASMTALNAINPVFWFRKLGGVISDSILEKIGIAVIGITGEETYKIYSKKSLIKMRLLIPASMSSSMLWSQKKVRIDDERTN